MSGHIIVGTAGHVDHGKTMLTAALTGVDTDRLPEEKRRGMTIVPGFVQLELDNKLKLGLIDVPGHEKFVKNMLAGVGGIDMALLVVAADEGVMPQTVEHLNILHLLGVSKGVVAITKCDMVGQDEEWLELIHNQVRELLSGTILKDAPIINVSANTGYNIDKLKQLLGNIALEVKERPTVGFCRLPVDRIFTKPGFGTVVTGTLWEGSVEVGQRLELVSQGIELRVRGLQVHGEPVEYARAGQRTAINLAGPGVEKVSYGCWLAEPGLLRLSYRMDIKLSLLANAKELKHRTRFHIFHGTMQVSGRIRLLDRESLKPGQSCLCQLELEEPLSVLRGDKLILRTWSPELTVAGAVILDSEPRRYKLSDANTISMIARKEKREIKDIVLDFLDKEEKPMGISATASLTQLQNSDVEAALRELIQIHRVIKLDINGEISQYVSAQVYVRWRDKLTEVLKQFHSDYPLRKGVPVASIRNQVFGRISTKQFSAVLNAYNEEGIVKLSGSTIAAAGFECVPRGVQKQKIDWATVAFNKNMFSPPDWNELMKSFRVAEKDGAEYLNWMLEDGRLVCLSGIYYSKQAIENASRLLHEQYEVFTVSQARDVLNTTRKFVIPLLNELDARGITVRKDDTRSFITE